MTMLFDSNKRLIKVSSIYPEDVQLGKGTYTIRALLRHDDRGESQVPMLRPPRRKFAHVMLTMRCCLQPQKRTLPLSWANYILSIVVCSKQAH